MPPTILAPPAQEPITLADARAQCRASAADDVFLELAIRGARAKCEGILQRSLISREVRQTYPAFDAAGLRFDLEPVAQVLEVRYTAADGTDTVLAADAWQLATSGPYPLLVPAWGLLWPSVREGAGAVAVRYQAGYGLNPADVPDDIRTWLLLTVGTLYEQRSSLAQGASVQELAGRFHDSLLDPYRRYGF